MAEPRVYKNMGIKLFYHQSLEREHITWTIITFFLSLSKAICGKEIIGIEAAQSTYEVQNKLALHYCNISIKTASPITFC